MSAWVLPDHIADVLPSEARHIEEIRRDLLDMARCYGYELVMPPLLEHLESLLSGTGEALDLQTFKLVDQLSGRMMGLRADSTPQVARIDAHLLNRQGVARLCYCGPVLHTRPGGPHASREPLQFGAEIYGHAGLEADLEILTLALDALRAAKVGPLTVDLANARIVSALLGATGLSAVQQEQVHAALAGKDASELQAITATCPSALATAPLNCATLAGRWGPSRSPLYSGMSCRPKTVMSAVPASLSRNVSRMAVLTEPERRLPEMARSVNDMCVTSDDGAGFKRRPYHAP